MHHSTSASGVTQQQNSVLLTCSRLVDFDSILMIQTRWNRLETDDFELEEESGETCQEMSSSFETARNCITSKAAGNIRTEKQRQKKTFDKKIWGRELTSNF
jgi:hypothetical protein